MKRFLLPAFALALAVNANATSFQANMSAEQQTETAKSSLTYKGKLQLDISDAPDEATIIVTEENNGTYTFTLKKFMFMGDIIGDAIVSNLQPTKNGEELILEANKKDVPIVGGLSNELEGGKVVMTMKASIKNNVLTAEISSIEVTFLGSEEPDVTVSATFTSDSYFYNIFDGGFDGEWGKCVPWNSKGNTKEVGTQPSFWNISNVYAGLKTYNREVGTSITGFNNYGKAVKLSNSEAAGQKIPAYFTLGTPWSTATDFGKKNADGGSFGGLQFGLKPDAMSFDYQRDNSNGKENATVIAYIWKGNWTQTNVPGNVAITGSPKTCTMVNRDRNVLGNETSATLGDPAKPSEGAKLIAKLEQSISESTKGTWKSMTIPFTYNDKTAVPEYINVIFAANDYFGDRNGIVAGNSLTIDNVKLVYYHALNSLTYNDTPVANFDEGTTEYTLNGKLAEDFDKVKFTIKGAGATYDVAKDEANNVATITVKGNDYDVYPSSKTVYTIKFDGTVGIHNVTSTSTNSANGAIYDLSGRQLKTMQKGINIVRGKDGKMIKVMK